MAQSQRRRLAPLATTTNRLLRWACAINFVTSNPLCKFDTLGQVVTKRFGAAAWALVKRDVVNNAKHATPIWRNQLGQLAMNQSRFAAAAPQKAAPAAPAPAAANATATYVLVNSRQTCATALAALDRVDAVGVDCEGSLDLDSTFFLRLVQVGITTAHGGNLLFCAYLFDMKAIEADTREAIANILRWLLEARTITKVFHDLRRDVPALCRELQVHRAAVQSLLDTQVLFELLVESALEPRRYAGARASLSDVLRACDLPVNEQKKQFQAAFNEAFWREPQLSPDKLRYDDVRYLVQLRDIMLRRLSLGVASWSARYAAYFEEHEADIDGANNEGDPFGALCRLTFTEPVPPLHMPRAVATLVANADDNDAQGDIGMPPASLLTNMEFEPEFDRLLDVLPPTLAERLRERHDLATLRHSLAELIVDAGFAVDLYHRDGRRERLHDCVVGKDELNALVGEWRDANMVGVDNRVTIEHSLHRISVKIDRLGDVDGLTCRVGKHMPGAAALLRDVVARVARKGASLLLLGPPGSGKTTLLREVAKELADEYDKRVNVVDTSNEIAGDGERKHPAIGSARRTAVPFDLRSSRHNSSDAQAIVMREVIANHTPEVLVVDELCTKAQAAAAASCGQRGVALVATAHGRELVELRRNAELNRLLGGFESFPVSDAEQARLGAASKAVPSRLGLPVFDIVVELRKVGEYVVHMDATDSVDALLAQPGSETPAATVSHRWCSAANGAMWVRFEEFGGSAALLRRRNRRPRRAGGERRADRGWLSALQEEGQQK